MKQITSNMRIYSFLIFFTILLFSSCDFLQKTSDVLSEPNLPSSTYNTGTANFEYWKHAPMHVGDYQPVTFQVKATDNQLVTKVELYIYQYTLFKDAEGLPSKRKSENGQWGLAKTWEMNEISKEVSLEYEYTAGFPPQSNVEYIFKIINNNNELTERFAMFDAGTSPWENDKILLYSASRKPLSQTINLCFFPDIDFKKNWSSFLNQTKDLIYQGYHANNMITEHKEMWSFYYTRQEADGYEMLVNPGNDDAFPQFMKDEMIIGVDAYGLLHSDVYPDRTYFRTSFNFLASNVFTTEIFNYGTAVHETGHAIFRLSDEYDGCACFQSELGSNVFATIEECDEFNETHNFSNPECNILKGYNDQPWYSPEKNILFRTEQECKDFNIANGFPKDSCQLFSDAKGNWFRAHKGVCIMQDDGDRIPNSFQRTCQIPILNYYAALENTVAAVPDNLPPSILVNNIYGYEAVVLVELTEKENKEHHMKVVDLRYGVPSKNILKGRAIDLSFVSEKGEMIQQVSLDNPSHVLFHGANGNEIEDMGHGSCIVAIPFNKDLAKVSMDFKKIANRDIAIRGSVEKPKMEFDIAKSVESLYLEFINK